MTLGYIVIDDGTDRERWLGKRTLGVSATDAARIMTGGAGAWASLRTEKETGRGFGGNAYTQHGREREEAIAAWAQWQFGLAPSTALLARTAGMAEEAAAWRNMSDADYADVLNGRADGPRYALDLATPDALDTADDRCHQIGEYKTTVHDWQSWADVPKRYHWQVVWQLYVTGADRCRFVFEPHEDFVPLYPEPRLFTVERANVLDDIEAAAVRVAAWRANDDPGVPEGLEDLDGLLSARERAKEAADAAEARAVSLTERIRALAASHVTKTGDEVRFEGTDASVTFTGKTGTRASFDSKAFAARYPAAARRFTKTTPTQPRLTITARS